ncbi:MAG: hypothetical protein HN673_08150, partial [Rhodospirillales bacterium]|nr:hypothetical protein [Rhodospirillales bacterium]
MAFNNTIAKIFYDRVERDSHRFDMRLMALSTELRSRLKSARDSKFNKCVDEFVGYLENELPRHEGLVSLTSAKLKGKYYGAPYYYVSAFILVLDEATKHLELSHDGYCLSHKKSFYDYYSLADKPILLTDHAIDRVYERHPLSKIRRDTGEFITNLKQLLICLVLELNEFDKADEFFAPVPGGAFVCERAEEKIVLKTFYGPDQLVDKWLDYEEIT